MDRTGQVSARSWGIRRWVAAAAPVLFLALIPSARGGVVFTTLFSFAGTNGDFPIGTLVQHTDGNFYGVTENGGAFDSGTLFRLTPEGTFTTLFNFDGTNGAGPHAGLVAGSDGNFYGTTMQGGRYGGSHGNGTIFKVTFDGGFTSLVSFAGTDGAAPGAELVEGTDGNFYGTTSDGGEYTNQITGSTFGWGTVFRVTPTGELSTLANFDGTNGGTPWAALTLGADGNFYGTTRQGGPYATTNPPSYNFGSGTLFRVDLAGNLTSLYPFGTNYGGSLFGLARSRDGNFYESSYFAGTNFDSTGHYVLGIVSTWTTNGEPSPIFAFDGTNGCLPRGIMQASDGNLYGVTGCGGTGYTGSVFSGSGTVFRLTTDGLLTTLVAFTNNEHPFGGLLQAADGDLYGLTQSGGNYGHGTVFRLSVPMPPRLQSATQAGTGITTMWTAVAGQIYQAQFATNLAAPSWINLGPSITATNGTLQISDSPGPDPTRFYRLILLP